MENREGGKKEKKEEEKEQGRTVVCVVPRRARCREWGSNGRMGKGEERKERCDRRRGIALAGVVLVVSDGKSDSVVMLLMGMVEEEGEGEAGRYTRVAGPRSGLPLFRPTTMGTKMRRPVTAASCRSCRADQGGGRLDPARRSRRGSGERSNGSWVACASCWEVVFR